MKKNSLAKAIGVLFLLVVVLTWIIPTGAYSEATFTKADVVPVGIINLFRLPVLTVQTFIQYTIVLLAIGIFYGVLNKTGVYDNIVRDIAKRWKGKEKALLIVVSVCFALMASLSGLSMLLFLMVPFVAAILLVAGYDKMTALLATVGSILVGNAASTFGFTGAGYIKNVFAINMTDELVTKVILFVILTFLYVFFVVKHSDVKAKTKEEEIPFFEADKKNKKGKAPLVIVSIIFVVLCAIGMYNWYYGLGVTTFTDFDKLVQGVKIGNYPIMANLLNGITALGYWGNYELAVALVIVSCIVAWLYNVSLKDFYEGIVSGAKEMLPIALVATLCNVVFTIMLSGNGNIYATLLSYMANIKTTFSVPLVTLMSLTGSIFFNDFYYLLSNISGIFGSYEAVYYPLLGVMTTALHGIMMMLLPTSVLLVAGLKMFNIEYIEWLKKVWKYLLEAFAVIILVAIIVTILI